MSSEDAQVPGTPAGGDVEPAEQPSRDSRKLDCIICYSAFNLSERLPRQLYCGHTFCQECLSRLDTVINEQQTWIPCPQCRQNTPLPRGGATALDLDLSAALGIKAELENQRINTWQGGGAHSDRKLTFGKQPITEQPPPVWGQGALAVPHFHRSPCCRRCISCCWN